MYDSKEQATWNQRWGSTSKHVFAKPEKRTLSAMLCGSVAWPLLALILCFGCPEPPPPPVAGAEAPKLCPLKFQAQTKSELVHNIKTVSYLILTKEEERKWKPVEEVENGEFGWMVGRRLGERRRRRCREVEQKKGQHSEKERKKKELSRKSE